MAPETDLPYWAEEYVLHIKEYRPKMYKELKVSGELETVALQVQESASAAFERWKSYFMSTGSNETSARTFANSEVMREYICLTSEEDEEDEDYDEDDEFDDED
jgi:hypothetical protein